jgi:HEAT repeat protein
LLSFGEAAGDYFVEGLTARKSFTRQACALALGELKLRRAVVPLVHQMLAEKTPIWSEIARALGRYGVAAVKPLQRYLRDPKGKDERLVLALSFLAAAGAAKKVENLRSGDDPKIASLAEQALDLRDEARAIEEQVQGTEAAEGEASYLKFSRRLTRALSGEEELDDEELEELDDEDLLEVADEAD